MISRQGLMMVGAVVSFMMIADVKNGRMEEKLLIFDIQSRSKRHIYLSPSGGAIVS